MTFACAARASLLLLAPVAFAACAVGEGAPFDAGVDAQTGDAPLLFEAAPNDDATPADVAEDATTNDGACTPSCATCGADDGCGGKCQSGSCPSGQSCHAGACSCTPSACTTCGADDGCGGKCQSGSCPGGATCVAGACAMATTSFLAPPQPGHFYTPSYGYIDGFARNLIFSIGSEAPSTIVYTTDGSMPGPSSPHGTSPVTFPMGSDGVIQWFADTGVPEGTRSANVTIDARLQTYYGFLVDVPNLGPDGPVAVVSPGATVSGTANWQAWTSPACPGCRYQLIYGVETTEAGCFWDSSVGAWPGKSQIGGAFSVTAPSAPGTYRVNVTYELQLSCADGMATNPLGSRPTQTFAWIVVK